MINGVSLSQLDDVNLTKVNHYRRISQVEHSRYTRFSVLDPELAKIFQNRKLNHERWKKFNHSRFTTEIEKCNDTYRKKLDQIKLGKSVYAIDKNNSPMHTKGSSFLNRKRNFEQIQSVNPGIARKIINARGSLERNKNQTQFSKYRENVHRLERFNVLQRMTSYSQRKTRVKTEISPKNSSISPLSPQAERKLSLFRRSPNSSIFKP